jgi:hypothetical protein
MVPTASIHVADVRTLADGEGSADRVATVLLPGAVLIEIRIPAGEASALQRLSPHDNIKRCT